MGFKISYGILGALGILGILGILENLGNLGNIGNIEIKKLFSIISHSSNHTLSSSSPTIQSWFGEDSSLTVLSPLLDHRAIVRHLRDGNI